MQHVPTYEPFMLQHSTRELAGGSQPCLFLTPSMESSEFDTAQFAYDIGGRIVSDTSHSVGQHQKDTTVRSRAASSQSHVLQTKHGTETYLHDPNGRQSAGVHHGRTGRDKKSSGGSLKRVDPSRPDGRHKQKATSKKGHVKSDKRLGRSESFTADL